MKTHRDSPTQRLTVDFVYAQELAPSNRKAFELAFINLLKRFGFTFIAGSRRGASAAATKETIESVFRTGVKKTTGTAIGGTFGAGDFPRLTFDRPPVIPDELKPFVARVAFSPLPIPLL